MKFSDQLFSNNNVLIVDAMNVAFRWKHQGKTDFSKEYLRTVQSLAQSYECSHIIIAADQGASSFRKELCPEYKANRKEKYKDQTPEEKLEMEKFFTEYEKTLELLAENYLVLRRKNVEADDLAAYIVRYKEKFGIEEIWLISSDRDWDLLVSDDVSRFSTVTRKETTSLNWNEFFDFPQEQYISFKVLTGDKGDNIPGIPGIGPKRASELIHQYGTAFDIYDSIPINGRYKYIQTLNENAELLLQNYSLMDLLSYCSEAVQHPGHSLEEMDNEIREYLNDCTN
jgi:5'-3' exonuclease